MTLEERTQSLQRQRQSHVDRAEACAPCPIFNDDSEDDDYLVAPEFGRDARDSQSMPNVAASTELANSTRPNADETPPGTRGRECEASSHRGLSESDDFQAIQPASGNARLINFLVDQLLGLHGCSDDEHVEAMRGREQANSMTLASLGQNTIECLGPNQLVLNSNTFLSSQDRVQQLCANKCKILFEGAAEDAQFTLEHDVAKFNQVPLSASATTFDIDSFLAVPRSLGCARRGFKVFAQCPKA